MTNLPPYPLDAALFACAQSLLDEEWLAKDADLAPVLPTVLSRGVGQDWHKAGTFRHHLVGVARSVDASNFTRSTNALPYTLCSKPSRRTSRGCCHIANARATPTR